MVFYGSPLTLTLAYTMSNRDTGLADSISQQIQNKGYFMLEPQDKVDLGIVDETLVSASEYQEALSYLGD